LVRGRCEGSDVDASKVLVAHKIVRGSNDDENGDDDENIGRMSFKKVDVAKMVEHEAIHTSHSEVLSTLNLMLIAKNVRIGGDFKW
jgi:hypothetical protein